MTEIDTSKEAVKYWSEAIRFSERAYPPFYKYDPDHGLLSRFIEALAAERDAAVARAENSARIQAETYDLYAERGRDNNTLRARVATLEGAGTNLRTAFVIAVGENSPFAKEALAQFDATLSAAPASAISQAAADVIAERPLTASMLADVFGCVWNAAVGEAHTRQAGMDEACIIASAFQAMAVRIQEISKGGE